MSKKKLNIVLDIGKTNVKLIFLDEKGQFFKEIKTKQTLKFYKKKISYLNSEKIEVICQSTERSSVNLKNKNLKTEEKIK